MENGVTWWGQVQAGASKTARLESHSMLPPTSLDTNPSTHVRVVGHLPRAGADAYGVREDSPGNRQAENRQGDHEVTHVAICIRRDEEGRMDEGGSRRHSSASLASRAQALDTW